MTPKYLLDTCVIVDLLRGASKELRDKILEYGIEALAISDITVFELYCGAEYSRNRDDNIQVVNRLIRNLTVYNSKEAYYIAAQQKYKLKKQGENIDDFDVLIASTAIHNGLTLVSSNDSHMSRLDNIRLENWR